MNQRIDLTYPTYRRLLELLDHHRFCTTQQLASFTRRHYKSERSALRQTLRHLRALHDRDLVARLERRVGGWRGGSSTSIWALTTRGLHHLNGSRGRLRPHSISTTFLQHHLAVTEVNLRAANTAAALDTVKIEAAQEPDCWRRYVGAHGEVLTLKPDLFLTVTSDEYEDHYFIEVDRDTENPARVIRKSWQYQQYRRSGLEQKQTGVFPAVVWVVPHEERKAKLLAAIDAEPRLPRELFVVITMDEVTALIRDGPPRL